MNHADRLYVAYSSDDRYAKFLGISMLSLLDHNQDFVGITVYVIDCGIQAASRALLEGIAHARGRDIVFLPVENIAARLRVREEKLSISIASYARLFLASLIPPTVERVLYLDCDTIVCASLRAMWETEMGDALMAGVQDTVDKYFLKVIGLAPGLAYVNAGILLVNAKQWREVDLETSLIAFIAKFGGKVPHHDQGTLNGVCGAHRVILPLRYNAFSNAYSFPARTIRRIYFLDAYYTEDERAEALRNPAIIHYTSGLFGRPWEQGCTHPEKDKYLKAAAQSPWKDDPLLPSTQKKGTRLFAAFYAHTPRPVFETVYRLFVWALHLKK